MYPLFYCAFFGPGTKTSLALLNGTPVYRPPIGVTNGVHQGGILSPVLFTVYLDELLQCLSTLNIGCHVGHHYVGSLCYADDIALLLHHLLLLEFFSENVNSLPLSTILSSMLPKLS